jgi:hypothetical protein
MEFKGTKGEWKVKKERGYDIDITNRDGDICWLGLSEFTDETKLANAKLIAAAPELLKALQIAKKELKRLLKEDGLILKIKNREWVDMDKAINKALN